MYLAAAITAALLASPPDATQPPNITAAIETAFSVCERWVLDPATHAERPAEFANAAGLADRISARSDVPEPLLPPPSLRVAMRHWYVSVGDGGFFVTVSDKLPFCHIAGGGSMDLKPAIEQVLGSRVFEARWKTRDDALEGDMWSTQYDSRKNHKFFMVVSRAKLAGDRTDRPQLLATAELKVGN